MSATVEQPTRLSSSGIRWIRVVVAGILLEFALVAVLVPVGAIFGAPPGLGSKATVVEAARAPPGEAAENGAPGDFCTLAGGPTGVVPAGGRMRRPVSARWRSQSATSTTDTAAASANTVWRFIGRTRR